MKNIVLRDWDTIKSVLKRRNVIFSGKRHLLSLYMGQTSNFLHFKGLHGNICAGCGNVQSSTGSFNKNKWMKEFTLIIVIYACNLTIDLIQNAVTLRNGMMKHVDKP